MEEDEGSVTVGLAEFASLKNEIQHRASAQLTLLSLDITAVGAIGGISLSQHQPAIVLFMAILCPALGIFYLDHDRHIRTLGAHIRDSLWPRIGRGIPSWESKNGERLSLPVVQRFFVAPVIVVVPPFKLTFSVPAPGLAGMPTYPAKAAMPLIP